MLYVLAIIAAPVFAKPLVLPDDPLGTVSTNGTSVGTVSDGALAGGAYLPRDGEHHVGLRRHRKRENRYGIVELVSLIQQAAHRVHTAHPEARLHVGNLSQKGGGDLSMSVSHNSGRDADLAFFSRDIEGQPTQPGAFVSFDNNGVSHNGNYRFDVPRNWALVKALIGNTESGADVQFLFISDGLRELLLDHARTEGEATELLERAATILKQPTGSSPHNDHLHLRVYCPEDDLLDGCRNYGPTWPWVNTHEAVMRRRVLAIAGVLGDGHPPERQLRAIELLKALRGADALPQLLRLVGREHPKTMRLAAIEALVHIRDPRASPPIATHLANEEDAEIVALMLDALASLHDVAVWPEVAKLIDDGRLCQSARQQEPRIPSRRNARVKGRKRGRETLGARAAATLGHLGAIGAIPTLIQAIDSRHKTQRRQAVAALRRLTNHGVASGRWTRKKRLRRKGISKWQAWWEAHKEMSQDRWFIEGFQAARKGAPENVDLVDDRWASFLLKAMKHRKRHIAHNARVTLRRIAKLRIWVPGDPYLSARWWRKWWRVHQQRRDKEGADVGLRGILRNAEPVVPVRTRRPRKERLPNPEPGKNG